MVFCFDIRLIYIYWLEIPSLIFYQFDKVMLGKINGFISEFQIFFPFIDMSQTSSFKSPSRTSSRTSSRLSQTSPRQTQRSPIKSPQKKKYSQKELEEIEELKTKPTQELMKMKRIAIEKLDFDLSGRIQEAMNQKTTDNTSEIIDKFSKILMDNIKQAVANYRDNVKDIEDDALNREIKIRKETEDNASKLQSAHMKQDIDLNVEYQVETLRNEKRENAEVSLLKRQAMASAKSDDIETANNFKKQAEELQEKIVAKRQKEIDLKFSKRQSQLEEKQKFDFDLLSSRLKNYLDQSDLMKNKALEDENSKIAVYTRHCLEMTTRNASKELSNKTSSREKQLKDSLSKITISYLKQENLDFVVDLLMGVHSPSK